MSKLDQIQISIDSNPLSMDPDLCSDYSGRQLLSLLTLPLVRGEAGQTSYLECCAAASYEGTPSGRDHHFQIREDVRWSDGSKISPSSYLLKIKKWLSGPPTIQRAMLAAIETISVNGRSLKFLLKEPDHHFPYAMELPGLSLQESGLQNTVGAYRITSRNKNSYILDPNPGFPHQKAPSQIRVSRIKSPQLNIEKFFTGKLDLTPDTAFPLNKLSEFADHPEFQSHATGIFVSMTFSPTFLNETTTEDRTALIRAIDRRDLSALVHFAYSPTESFITRPTAAHENSGNEIKQQSTQGTEHRNHERIITLGYDDYYPNFTLATGLKQHFSRQGLNIVLVKDSFEMRSKQTDLRLELLQGLTSHPLSIYQGLLYHPELAKHPEARSNYRETLREFARRARPTPEEIAYAADTLQNILNSLSIITPLLEVQGYQLSRLTTETPFFPGLALAKKGAKNA